MGFKEIIEKVRAKNRIYTELETQDRAIQKLEERKLSSNERELNKILEQRRQEAIKDELEKYHKQERKTYWHKDTITQKPIFVENKNLFVEKKNLFTHNPNVVKQKRLY